MSMKQNKRQAGEMAEIQAAHFLISHNYEVLNRNYHARFGEVDLIVRDLSQTWKNEIIFVEVKMRKSEAFGTPQSSITFKKRQRLIKTALHYLQKNHPNQPLIWRIDLIAVQLHKNGKLKEITHFKNILNG